MNDIFSGNGKIQIGNINTFHDAAKQCDNRHDAFQNYLCVTRLPN